MFIIRTHEKSHNTKEIIQRRNAHNSLLNLQSSRLCTTLQLSGKRLSSEPIRCSDLLKGREGRFLKEFLILCLAATPLPLATGSAHNGSERICTSLIVSTYPSGKKCFI